MNVTPTHISALTQGEYLLLEYYQPVSEKAQAFKAQYTEVTDSIVIPTINHHLNSLNVGHILQETAFTHPGDGFGPDFVANVAPAFLLDQYASLVGVAPDTEHVRTAILQNAAHAYHAYVDNLKSWLDIHIPKVSISVHVEKEYTLTKDEHSADSEDSESL